MAKRRTLLEDERLGPKIEIDMNIQTMSENLLRYGFELRAFDQVM